MCRDWNRAGTLFGIRGCSIEDCLWKRLLGLVGRGIGLVDMLVGVLDQTCGNGMQKTVLSFPPRDANAVRFPDHVSMFEGFLIAAFAASWIV